MSAVSIYVPDTCSSICCSICDVCFIPRKFHSIVLWHKLTCQNANLSAIYFKMRINKLIKKTHFVEIELETKGD